MSNLVEIKYPAPSLPAATAATIARALVVDSQDMADYADKELLSVKEQWKTFEAMRKEIVDPINASKDAVQKLFKPVLDDLAAAEDVYKEHILSFRRQQEKLQREEQARLDEIARKERERLERQAVKAEEKGHTEKAVVLAQTAAVITAPIATSTFVQAKGQSIKKTWKGRVKDPLALAAAIVANPVFANLLGFDQGAIDRLAKAMEGNVPLAGIECYQEESIARRAA